MKIFPLAPILLCGLASLLTSCEEVADANDVPYVEKLVVTGMLTADSTGDTIHFLRTLPLNQLYSPTEAELTDVDATIHAATSGKDFHLTHIGHGQYLAPGLVPQPRESYTLVAKWHDLEVSASTTVPARPIIEAVTVSLGTSEGYTIDGQPVPGYFIDAAFRPVDDAAFGLRYRVTSRDSAHFVGEWNYSYEFDELLKRREDAGEDGKLHLSPLSSPLYFAPAYSGVVWVFAYDRAYYNYFMTRHDNNDDGNPFATPGEKIRWNVQGDGIGIFVSRSIAIWTKDIE